MVKWIIVSGGIIVLLALLCVFSVGLKNRKNRPECGPGGIVSVHGGDGRVRGRRVVGESAETGPYPAGPCGVAVFAAAVSVAW